MWGRVQKICAVLTGVLVLFSGGTALAQSAPAAGGTFDQRLSQRKQEAAVTLDKKVRDRLLSRCVKAQNQIRTLQQQATKVVDNRNKAYQKIDALTWITIGRLKLAGQDTFELERQRAKFAEDTKTFQTTTDYYLQTLDDLTVINCQSDPEGFQALLQTARQYHEQIINQAQNLRTYVIDNIKASVSKYATDLQTKPSTEDQ